MNNAKLGICYYCLKPKPVDHNSLCAQCGGDKIEIEEDGKGDGENEKY